MQLATFKRIVSDTFETIARLSETKGKEYARSNDQLANFKRLSGIGLTTYQVWAVLYGKHQDAIFHFVQTHSTLSEPIENRIDDAILYLLLLKALVVEHRSEEPN